MKFQIKNRYTRSVIFETDAQTFSEAISVAIKAKVDFSYADFRGADLSGANLSSANFRRADLSGANLSRADLSYADFRGADLSSANFRRADLSGANLSRADLSYANLSYADLSSADLSGANLSGKKVQCAKLFMGLYRYDVMAILFEDQTRMVRMGCKWMSLEEWEQVGIRKSNLIEFPDDGSLASEDRVSAFEFAKSAALRMK